MNTSQVMQLLEANQNDRGIEHWQRLYPNSKLKSFGIGLTVQRKLAKQIGKNHELAMELWQSDYYDAKVIALLIDEPKLLTREQAEQQVEQLDGGMLTHVFSSCDATLAKTPFVVELASDWVDSRDPVRRSCAYGLLYEISKWKKKSAPDDEFFLDRMKHIENTFADESRSVQGSMGGALLGIGKRNVVLNGAALKLAKQLGPIKFDDDEKCEPMNLVKHLTSDYLKKKFAQ